MATKTNTVISVLFFLISACKQSNQSLLGMASQYYDNHNYEEAIQLCNKVIKDDSTVQLAYFNRGLCYFDLKAYPKALKDFEQVLALQPKGDFIIIPNKNSPFASPEDKLKVNFLDAIFRRGLTKYFMDSLQSAFIDFQACIDRDYELKSNCYLWQGSIYARVANKQKACELYNQGRFYAKDQKELDDAERLIKDNCR